MELAGAVLHLTYAGIYHRHKIFDLFGQALDLTGYSGKALALFPCPCRLNRSVEGKECLSGLR